MALQFAPAPTFSQPQSLVPEIKVQPVARQNVRTRDIPYRDRQQEKDERRDMLLALALGAGGGELIGKGLTSLIGKIPGVDKYFEDVEVSGPVPGATRADFEARARQMGLGPVETKAFVDASVQAEAIPEYSRARPAQTRPSGIKTLLEKGLSLAPAAALKTAKGVETFGDLYGRRQTAQATAETTKASNLQKAEEKLREQRAAMVRERSKAYLGDQKQVKFFGLDPNTGAQVSRNGIDVEGDRFVISQGTEYDVGTDGNIVPRGQLYRNPILTSNTGTEARGTPVWNNYMSQDGKTRVKMGYSTIIQNEDGSTRGATFIIGEGPNGTNLEVGPGNYWVIAKGDALNELKANLGKNENEEDFWAERADQANNAAITFRGIGQVVDILEKNPTALTVVGGAIPAALDTIEANLKGMEAFFGNQKISSVFNSKNDDGDDIYNAQERARALRLNILAKKYADNPNDPAIERQFLNTFEDFRGSVNDKYDAGPLGKLDDLFGGTSNQQVASARARVLAAQLRLAYQAAATAGQTGRTLSDKDLANFLQIVGYGGSQNPEVVKEQLYQFTSGILEDFDGNPTVFNWVQNPDEFSRYLRKELNIEDSLLKSALEETGAEARSAVLDAVQDAVGPAGVQFFKFEQKEDGTYELILKDFETYIGQQEVIQNVINSTRDFYAGQSSKSKTPDPQGPAANINLSL
jgi:hypothetical protein